MRKFILAFIAIFGVFALSACSSVSTNADQTAVHYNGGFHESRKFKDCVTQGTYKQGGTGDTYYIYPSSTNERTYRATGVKDASEQGPVTVVSKDNVEMRVPATVYFNLNSNDCAKLQAFHENIGMRYKAYWQGSSEDFVDANSDDIPDGWVEVLKTYVGPSVDRILDRKAQAQTWRDLWNNPITKASIENTIKSDLQSDLDESMGGHYIVIRKVVVAKPTPTDDGLTKSLTSGEKAITDANAQKAAAQAQEAAANAKKAQADAEATVAEAQARSKKAEVDAVGGPEYYAKIKAIEAGINPYPAPVVVGNGGTVNGGK